MWALGVVAYIMLCGRNPFDPEAKVLAPHPHSISISLFPILYTLFPKPYISLFSDP
jgi:serine/threonine protein kinase